MPAAESSKIQEKILTEQYSGGIMAVHETSWRLVGTVLETSWVSSPEPRMAKNGKVEL